jgi:hypothetical protein
LLHPSCYRPHRRHTQYPQLILAKEMLFLPFVGLFPDVDDLCRDHVPALGPAAIEEAAAASLIARDDVILNLASGV